ncbi:hypothetical protein PsorP6_003487 [Peronosclerospora sorghi]|uniref:Uncharacterized protein n=1 Tax=Peronosclerospora sorghi TaxID=230839 RepID=A0ACC0VLC9_9STRA|nr:hypothetical protein PsorP6_003487 [Peronosclerospora sorghi]
MKRESTAAEEESYDVYMNDVDLETSYVEDVTHVKTEAGTILASATESKILAAASSFKQPEVQHMNRLLCWLLSAEKMKRQHENDKYKKERVANEQRRRVAQEMRAMVQLSACFTTIACIGAFFFAADGGDAPTRATFRHVAVDSNESRIEPSSNDDGPMNTAESSAVTDCVLADFETASDEVLTLNNLVGIVQTSPSVLKQYLSDPLVIQNQQVAPQTVRYLGTLFEITPTIDWLKVSGITNISPMPVNVTSSNTLSLGVHFTDSITLKAQFTLEIAQPYHRWYKICWIHMLHPIKCQPRMITMDVVLAITKPKIKANVEANLYQCAPGISIHACQNLTMSTIMTGALSGNLSAVSGAIYKNFKDAKIDSVKLGWDSITVIDVVVPNSSSFVTRIINHMIDSNARELNRKGDYYHDFVVASQNLLLSMMNEVIDSTLEPLFRATCMSMSTV